MEQIHQWKREQETFRWQFSGWDVEEVPAVIPVLLAPAENSSQLSSSSDPSTELLQAASESDEKATPTPKQDDLRKEIKTEKDILLGR